MNLKAVPLKDLMAEVQRRNELKQKLTEQIKAIDAGEGESNERKAKAKSAPKRKAKRAKRKLLKNAKSIHEHMIEVLRKQGDGMTVSALAGAVLKHGFKTTSKHFAGVIRQTAKVRDQLFRTKNGLVYLKPAAKSAQASLHVN